MIKVLIFYVYSFLEPGASVPFLTLYVANLFEIFPEKLCETFCVSTTFGKSILAEIVYRACPIL